ncbi:class I adenylate-forming enzyme family protein [Amycolatopsis viridis]|uniref:Acyl-CoA synthetase (AMP-forming)/AMP-acid ligase II n=1 Tax=Amycolatopsis viridis TaxID=185678 RepID=A0ABX0SYS3_9PSEU|nr:AMP-binding protein [Amycolatopsis viridis]NIH80725.1 acyl-CoA synthetase (AMP-forming)/AMP-acid ligase II [Amycolatopsis viridis]
MDSGPTVASVLRRGYTEFADLPAVVDVSGTTTTYAELGRDARLLVTGLRNQGARHGDRIVVLTKNRPECFTLDHALAIGGFVRVALSYRLHPKEIADIVADSGAHIVVVDGERVAEIAGAVGADVTLVNFDGDGPGVPYGSLFGGAEAEPAEVSPADIAWMPYTSGTSGRPKGVIHTHHSLLSIIRNVLVELPGLGDRDVLVHTAPLTHLSGYAMLAGFTRGARQIALGRFEPAEYLRVVQQHRATVLPLVPTMINMLLPVLEAGEADVSSVHTVLYGGSPIAPDRLARAIKLFGPVFVQSYGLTEMPWSSWLSKPDHVFDPDGELPARLGSAGRVSPFIEMRLVTPGGRLAEDGEEGEIQLRGDARMAGYWNLPDETAAAIRDGGWVATGDVGRMSEGYLHVVDRKKDMIVSGGFNVYPAEVENAIYTVPGVAEVAVVGIPDERWGETVHAVVVPRGGATVTRDEIDRACLGTIAAYKRPRSVEFVSELPKTGTGKIMRRAVKERYWQGRARLVNG